MRISSCLELYFDDMVFDFAYSCMFRQQIVEKKRFYSVLKHFNNCYWIFLEAVRSLFNAHIQDLFLCQSLIEWYCYSLDHLGQM